MERAIAKTTDERIQNILRKKAEELEDTGIRAFPFY